MAEMTIDEQRPSLKSCAHCGRPAEYLRIVQNGMPCVYVKCTWCGIMTPGAAGNRYDVAARWWNTRLEDTKRNDQEFLERLKSKVDRDEDDDDFDDREDP